MKKLVFSTSLGLFLTLTACKSINQQLTVLGKCCKVLSLSDKVKTPKDQNQESEYLEASFLLPFNSWDGKMMIW